MKTFYSSDGIVFEYDNMGDLIDSLLDEYESAIGLKYYSTEGTEVDLTQIMSADWILPTADDYLYDNVHNGDGGWNIFQFVTNDAKLELNELLTQWALKHLRIKSMYTFTNKTKTHTITKDNIWDII